MWGKAKDVSGRSTDELAAVVLQQEFIATHQTHGAMLERDFFVIVSIMTSTAMPYTRTQQVYSTPGDMADTVDTADMVRFNFTF